MSDKPSGAVPAAKTSARSRVSLVILLLILGFFGYGIFERSRLLAAQKNEKQAIAVIADVKGDTIEADVKDWRLIFVPDQPTAAIRIGIVYVPSAGDGPGYTKKITDQLRAFPYCDQLYLSNGPLVKNRQGGGMFGGGAAAPPKEKKEEAKPKMPQEPLDLAVIRKEFPQIKIMGEDTLSTASKETAKVETTEEAKEAIGKEELAKEVSKEKEATSDSASEKTASEKTPAETKETPKVESSEKAPSEKKEP